jgi:hypothetical protein
LFWKGFAVFLGEVTIGRLTDENRPSSRHVFRPAEVVELARVTGRLPERYGFEVATFEPGAVPRCEVMETVDPVGRNIRSEISVS